MMHELLDPYIPTLTATAVWVLMLMLQNTISAAFKHQASQGEHVAGAPVETADHADVVFRLVRSFENSLENFGAFITTIALAIVFALDPFWVNLSACIFVVARAGHWAAYAANRQLLRSLCYSAGSFANLALAVAVLLVILF